MKVFHEQCHAPIYMLVFIAMFAPRGAAQNSRIATQSEPEIEQLRQRIARLEAENEAVLNRLHEIQQMLEAGREAQSGSERVEAASVVPRFPASVKTAPSPRTIPVDPAATPAPPGAVLTEGNKSEVSFYGFARLDAVLEDSRIRSSQTPIIVLPEPDGVENRGNFTLHPRLTRLGFNYKSAVALSSINDAALTGRIEFDFHNGGTDSRAIPRYRHTFLQLAWERHSILAGQTSDIISPLFPSVNADTLMWNAGNLGDRRAQFRYSYGRNPGFNLQAGVGMMGAIDAQDADANGVLDGEQSMMPNWQGRIGYTTRNSRVLLGLWSYYGRTHTDTMFAGKNNFEAWTLGGDWDLRFTPVVSLRGEWWFGSGLADIRGSVSQSFNRATGREIDSRGGWAELGVRKGRYAVSTGFTLDDPNNRQVAANAAILNRSWYVTNQFRLAPPVTAGVDYTFWQTRFQNLHGGSDNRINLYIMYGF